MAEIPRGVAIQDSNKTKLKMMDTRISEESSKKEVNMARVPIMIAIRDKIMKEGKMAKTNLSVRPKMEGLKKNRINDGTIKSEKYMESYTRDSDMKDEETGDNLANNNTTLEATAIICETKGKDDVQIQKAPFKKAILQRWENSQDNGQNVIKVNTSTPNKENYRIQSKETQQKALKSKKMKAKMATENIEPNFNVIKNGELKNTQQISVRRTKKQIQNKQKDKKYPKQKSEKDKIPHLNIIRTKKIIDDLDEEFNEEHNKIFNGKDETPMIDVQFERVRAKALVDTGAQISAITKSLYDSLVETGEPMEVVLIKKFILRGAFSERESVTANKARLTFMYGDKF